MSAGLRANGNSFTTDGNNIAKTLSPRLNASFALAKQWNLNANIGSYTKIAPYTALGYRDNNNNLANTDVPYTRCNRYVTGLEYLPSKTLSLTVEGFYKQCSDFLVRDLSGISLPIWVVMAASLAMKKWSAAAKAKPMASNCSRNKNCGKISFLSVLTRFFSQNSAEKTANWSHPIGIAAIW